MRKRIVIVLLTLAAALVVRIPTGVSRPAGLPEGPTASQGKVLSCSVDGRAVDVPRFWLGTAFEGLKLNAVLRRCDPASDRTRANFASYIYGDCTPKFNQGCAAPLEIQTFPACERNADSYSFGPVAEGMQPQELTIEGRSAASFSGGHRLELYRPTVTVVIFGRDVDQVRRAALRLTVAPARPGTLQLTCTAEL